MIIFCLVSGDISEDRELLCLQEAAFIKVFQVLEVYEIFDIFPSVQSFLHQTKGCAATTQFHPGIIGEAHFAGILPITLDGHQKHAATQTHQVRVGVTYKRKKFVGELVHNKPQAQRVHQQDQPG
ncbi:TPA: hypothetical protein DEG21_00320 [Patescibacteria group bacterium]|nr:hypothetical protein [Candidatus Gracilibacteria bacterium]HBY74371.1 hypothetical protein [Candidatus Gracilibacteria bacterium]